MSTSTLDRPGGQPAPAPDATPAWARTSRRLWRGNADDDTWVRPALLGLLLATAVLYLWGLGASGYANGFYSAAVQAGSHSWKAFFFGSFDASSFITVDKPPASLWVMDVSARVFGVNAWSILVPQALEGVAAVGLLYLTVRRRFGPAAGILAGAVMATTPVAALMFRFNNPDALLVLLLVASAYAMVRALEAGRTRWIVAAGAFVGFAFLAKMLQAVVVLPGFALVYLYAAPVPFARRVRQVLAGGAAAVVAAGWWVAAVALTPAADRPYVGGSQHNSILELTLGYNGLGRLTGQETGSVGGGGAGTGRWGATGIGRMFNAEFGGQVSWLLPAALGMFVALLYLGRRAPRTSGQRAQVLLWGSWLVVTGLTFSLAAGIIHPYYAVALAPAIGALVGIGATSLWRHRAATRARVPLALILAVTAWWSHHLLARTPQWHPALRTLVLVVGLATAAAIAAGPSWGRRATPVVAAAGLLTALAGPAAYAVETAATPHGGAIPSAGPSGQGATGPGAGRPGAGGPVAGGPGGPGGGGPGAFRGVLGGRPGGLGGLLDTATPGSALVNLLRTNASTATWAAATVGSNSAAGVQLATGLPVMAIGGFNGTDPTPSLAAFQALVRGGAVHYFLASGSGGGRGANGPGGGSSQSQAITAWVESTYASTTVGGVTVYDLTAR
jgi:4-amino-4-deoxy-L-arabinose transferase-like glycosyltransferase